MQCDRPELFPAARRTRDTLPLYSHLIGNQWVVGAGPPLPVTAPATGRRFAWLAGGGAPEIDAAARAARAALAGDWGRTTATERGRLMMAFASLVLVHAERLAWIEAHDTGKPISQANADMRAVARYFEFYGGAADKIHGEVIPYLKVAAVATRRLKLVRSDAWNIGKGSRPPAARRCGTYPMPGRWDHPQLPVGPGKSRRATVLPTARWERWIYYPCKRTGPPVLRAVRCAMAWRVRWWAWAAPAWA